MTLPKLPSVADIHSRLERLFTPGLEMRKNLVREMAAKTVFVFLCGGMVDGRWATACHQGTSEKQFWRQGRARRRPSAHTNRLGHRRTTEPT